MNEFAVTDLIFRDQTYRAAALMTDGRLTELRAERAGLASRTGCIYRGIVETDARQIGGCFVLVGRERMFLKAGRAEREAKPVFVSRPVPVQITREASGRKEACVTRNLSLTGRLLVLYGDPGPAAFSKKLTEEEKRVTGKWLTDAGIGPEFKVLVRTAAAGAGRRELLSEYGALSEKMREILLRFESAPAGKLLYAPDPFYVTMCRDLRTPPDRVLTDIPAAAERLSGVRPGIPAECTDAAGPGLSLADRFGLPRMLEKLTQKMVWLKSGAFLVIEQTEAFVSIDVNTGRSTKGRIPEETYRRVNLEAAEEIAAQLRLRNLSGMILVDFISLKNPDHKDELLHVMRKHLRRDMVKAEAVDITPLGIMEIVREKREKPLAEVLGIC